MARCSIWWSSLTPTAALRIFHGGCRAYYRARGYYEVKVDATGNPEAATDGKSAGLSHGHAWPRSTILTG